MHIDTVESALGAELTGAADLAWLEKATRRAYGSDWRIFEGYREERRS